MPSDAPRFFSVWLKQSNMTYSGVPFTVICDWISEGRVTVNDCVRTAGQPSWDYLGDHKLFAPYFQMGGAAPTPEAIADEMNAIDLEIPHKKEHEDDEVDMIPLIDISLVLLVFFMMTAQNLITESPIKNPEVKNSSVMNLKGEIQVAMAYDEVMKTKLVYYFSEKYKEPKDLKFVLEEIKKAKDGAKGEVKVIIQAAGAVPFNRVQDLTIELDEIGVKYFAKVKGASGSPSKPEGGK